MPTSTVSPVASTTYESPYLRLAGGHLPVYQPGQLRSSSALRLVANACVGVDSAIGGVIAYEDDIIMGMRAGPQLAPLAATGDARAVEVASMLSSKQACRQGLASHPPLVPAIIKCLPSQQAVDAVANMSRDSTMATAFFEAGAGTQMVNIIISPPSQPLLKHAVIALRNMLANQAAEIVRTAPLPADTVSCLCQLVNINSTPFDIIAPAADCLRLIGNVRSGNEDFRTMLSVSGPDGPLAQRIVAALLNTDDARIEVQRKVAVAMARLVAAMSSDEQCRLVLVETGVVQALAFALTRIRDAATSAEFQVGSTNAVLLGLRNATESISLVSLSAAHSLENQPLGFDQVIETLTSILITCLGKLPPTALAYTAGTLANLVANSSELKEVAVVRGAVDWLVQAATVSAEVLEPAMIALAHLTAHNPAASDAQAALLNAGAIGRLFRVLTPAASSAAAALARNLMLSAVGRITMVEQIGNLVTLLAGPACTDAAAALWLLSRDQATNSIGGIIRQGAIPAASRMLFEDHPPEAQCAAAALLWQLTAADPHAAVQLDQEGVAAPLTVLLHSPDQAAAAYAAALLRRLAENRSPAFRQRMNTELAQSLHHSAANIGMTQSGTFQIMNGPSLQQQQQQQSLHSPGSDSHLLLNGGQVGTQQPQVWLDTDL